MFKRLMSIGVAAIIIGGAVWTFSNRADESSAKSKTATNDNTLTVKPRAQTQETQIIAASQETTDQARLILSGTGNPDASVQLRKNTQIIAETLINDTGTFELPLSISRPEVSGALGLIASYDVVTPKTGEGPIINDSALVVARAPDAQSIAALLCAPGGATQILRSPFSKGLPESDGLTFISGDYDNAGGVIFSGRSTQAGRIRILANRSIIGETGLADDGSWVLIAGSTLPVGQYKLTVQRIDANGTATAQMVLPFERKAPAPISIDETASIETPIRAEFSEDQWHISRALHGGGTQHTVIYSALALVP